MFEWFNKKFSRGTYHDSQPTADIEKITSDTNKVVPFPELKTVPSMPKIEPPGQGKESTTYYSIGHTDDNRISIRMGYTTLTMNKLGIQHLISQLELFQGQLRTEEEEDTNE